MKLYRYMSTDEFTKMIAGINLVNKNTFTNNRTESAGFCFLSENTNGYTPVEAILFLQGIVTNDVLVEFTVDPKLVSKSSGVYIDPVEDGLLIIDEYCTVSYNRDLFKPCKYALVENSGKAIWYDFN